MSPLMMFIVLVEVSEKERSVEEDQFHQDFR
jgi:hypothetical protein